MKEDLGSRVRARRMELRLTQEKLAHLAGVLGGTVYRIEAGIGMPSTATIVALARELGVSTDWLLTGEGTHEHVVRQGDEDLELRDSEAL